MTSYVMPYFVGEFNGDTFVETQQTEEMLLLDYGMDNYAMVSFLHSPEPLLLGWGECWDDVSQTLVEAYCGKMTMARKTKLVKTEKAGETVEFEAFGSGKLMVSVTENEIHNH